MTPRKKKVTVALFIDFLPHTRSHCKETVESIKTREHLAMELTYSHNANGPTADLSNSAHNSQTTSIC